ncbi:unnamed protein product [Vitrella brassicaformis CCMP3155]|uniref:S-adenosyl-L-methionine-dependent methyltransferase n=2 Tax=Vitrella brassicaformis TaxID=1169539 RepID=A0A0G4GVD7_VITBC|nr:unnamed protein product [Vitrella brassicaformis CCMP3155]|eukprot:CEM34857.1 unnamed protein product [Vitrella brassicaformis CCMP3155]
MTKLPPPCDLPISERAAIARFISYRYWWLVQLYMLLPTSWLIRLIQWSDKWKGGGAASIFARTKLVDKLIQDGVEAAATDKVPLQLVILGAGYDTRWHRFAGLRKQHAVKMFEVDQQAVQQDKLSLMKHRSVDPASYEDVRFVSCDFNTESLESVLLDAGFVRGQRSLFIWEGVTMYLTEEGVAATLAAVRSLSVDSTITFDYIDKALIDGAVDPFWSRVVEMMKRNKTPITYGIVKGEVNKMLKQHDFEVVHHWDHEDMRDHFLRDAEGRPFGDCSRFGAFVQARPIKR